MRSSRAYRKRLRFVFCLPINQKKTDEDDYKLMQQNREVVPSPAIIPLKSKGHLFKFSVFCINMYIYMSVYIHVCKYKTSFQNIHPVLISDTENNFEFILAGWLLKKPQSTTNSIKSVLYAKTKGRR